MKRRSFFSKINNWVIYILLTAAIGGVVIASVVLIDYLRKDMITIEKDSILNEVFSIIADSTIPVAVVHENRLQGILIKGIVLQALVGDEEVEENE